MKLAVDVHYAGTTAFVAGICFDAWTDEVPTATYTATVLDVADYEPGEFYKRELPCILALLNEHELVPDIIIVDGYVFLDGQTKAGLGKHLFDALHGKVCVIGVAKKPFLGIDSRYALYRGQSSKPLYVTCSDENISTALDNIRTMSGRHRIPVLLKMADQVCRQQR